MKQIYLRRVSWQATVELTEVTDHRNTSRAPISVRLCEIYEGLKIILE